MKKFILKKLLPVSLSLSIIGGIYLPINTLAATTGTINAVATSHLDTNWSWNLEKSIEEYLPETFEENADLIKDYPDYKFNFEGAYRYELLKEYYPEKFEQLKKYISDGSWNISGTAYENGDVNIPSPEALFRDILYGNNYFLDNFSKTSKDIYLPDCFGFGYALPSIMAHTNLLGFSTQKLNWGNTFPNGKLPFSIGMWKGPDGKSAIADINLNGYWNAHTTGFRYDNDFLNRLSNSPVNQITALFGACGDRGGGASNLAVKTVLSQQAQNSNENVKIKMNTTDGLMKSLTQEEKDNLPVYDGELVMKQHGTGSYTSKVISKRWNRQAEQMAYAAELANVNSAFTGATTYPTKQFEEYWKRVIAHQFHDDITGTSNSDVYMRSYNDLMLSIKQFANEYQSGVSGVVRSMDTTSGSDEVTLVVNNPLGVTRTGTVIGTVTMPQQATDIKVTDDNGNAVVSQIISKSGNNYKIAFNATVKSLGYRKYIVKGVSENSQTNSLSVTENSLSNEKYTVTINTSGDISSIFDKELNKELLSEPIRLGIFNTTAVSYAAWELKMEDYYNIKPQNYVSGTPDIQIVENGAARVAIKITRKYNNSTFQQIVSLSSGGKMVQVDNVVDWQEKSSILKAEFNLKPNNPNATYDLGLGAITRGNNTADKAEVPVQKWADLTNSDNSYGVSIVNDCKYGMDKLDNDTMRLTLIHTPTENFTHSGFYPSSGQNTQDIGENRFSYAIYGHQGTYANSDIQHLAEGFNQPMYAFQTDKHSGSLGSNYSFGELSNNNVIIRAIKKAEKSDEIIVRVNEGSGVEQKNVTLSLGNGIASAREVYATEENIGAATVSDNKLVFDIGKYGVKTYAITLKPSTITSQSIVSADLTLPYNTDVYSSNNNKNDCSMTYVKDSYPSELVPDKILSGGIEYLMGDKTDGENNAVRATGQTLNIPAGYTTLNLLAVSTNGDKLTEFTVGNNKKTLEIADFSENVAAWDISSLNVSGYVKDQTPAFVSTHRHSSGKDLIAKTTYMFSYKLDLSNADNIVLPDDRDIIIFAAKLTNDSDKSSNCITQLNDQRARSSNEIISDIASTITFDGADKDILTNVNFEERNVSNTSCTLSTEKSFSGDTSLKLTGNDDSGSAGFTYYTIYSKPIKVMKDTVLSYRFYAANDLGRYTSVDMAFDSGLPLRDRNNAFDQNNIQMHPSRGRGTVGQWVEVKCNLGEVAEGQTITRVMFAYDHVVDTGNFTSYVDDLKISTPSDTLINAVENYSKITNDGYSTKSFSEFRSALLNASDAVNSSDASEYEIYTAAVNLKEAFNALQKIVDATKTVYGYNFTSYKGCVNPDRDSQGKPYALGNIVDTSYVSYTGLDFGANGANVLRLSHAGKDTTPDARVIVYKGATPGGEALGTLLLPATGDWNKYNYSVLNLKQKLTGEQDICLVFRSESTNTCNIKTMDFTLDKAEQLALEISNGNITKQFGDTSFKLTTKGGLGKGAVTYSLSNPDVASIDKNGNVTLLGAGTTTITAKKASDDNYFEVSSNPITLTVNPISLSDATVADITNQTYTGKPITPSVTVTKGTKILVAGVDYSIEYSNNINCGKAGVTITGLKGYTGKKTLSFIIQPIKLTNVSVSKIADKVYTGKSIVPPITVKTGSVTLKNNVDYTIKYSKNSNPGKATVTIKGRGNYSFTSLSTFYIVPKSVTSLKVKPSKNSANISYKKSAGISGYKITYSTNKNFKKSISLITTKTNTKIKKLKSECKYYVQVSAFVKVGSQKVYSKPTKLKSFKTK